MKNKKGGGRVGEEFVSAQFPRRFLKIFFALSTPHGFRSNSKENKQTNKQTKSCYRIPCLKDFGGFKSRREMSRFQVVPFAISANPLSTGCILSGFDHATLKNHISADTSSFL